MLVYILIGAHIVPLNIEKYIRDALDALSHKAISD